MSLDGIEWRSSAESASGDIAFDDALWKRIFQKPIHFLKDSHFTSDDISVDINTATQMFLGREKQQCFMVIRHFMQEFQEQMDAELTRIPFFHRFLDEAFINMTPSLNIAFNKRTWKRSGKTGSGIRCPGVYDFKRRTNIDRRWKGCNFIKCRCSKHDGRCTWT